VVLALGAGVGACGGEEETDSAQQGGGGQGVELTAAEFTWSAAAVTTSILKQIAEQNPELGVSELKSKQLDPAPAWAGAKRGDIDILAEVARPNQDPLAKKAGAEVEMLGATYEDASQGWFVPSYVVAPGGPAEGLKSVDQLNEYKEVFDGKLIDADPGWVTTEQNKARLKGYGIDFQHVTSGEAAQLAQLKRAIQREEPILTYNYRPHWVFAEYELTQLEEPNPYKEGCFDEGGDGACAMPPYSAWTAARKDVAEKAPKFHAMLKEFKIPLEDMEAMLAKVDLEKQDAEAVAKEWVDANQADIKSWVSAAGGES
jgi:glycine betaine/proline transport system substrate-binding protein